MFRPADRDDLIAFLRGKPADVPVTVIGVGSNLLVRDGGIRGVVLRLGRDFARIDAEDAGIIAGATALDVNIAEAARRAGIGGLEFLSGVPGTLGGALRMNAGAYGREIKDVLVWAEAVTPEGQVKRVAPDEMALTYRKCGLPADWIFLGARLAGHPDDPEAIGARIAEIKSQREDSQPIRTRTGGSTFKNPPGLKAWKLIDEAGCRGLTIGGAQVSKKHCNFLINTGNATAHDLETLGEEVRRRVEATAGVDLQWEIRRIGEPGGGEA
jgi:UDP-N-acetylmuramate dehydrogenase